MMIASSTWFNETINFHISDSPRAGDAVAYNFHQD